MAVWNMYRILKQILKSKLGISIRIKPAFGNLGLSLWQTKIRVIMYIFRLTVWILINLAPMYNIHAHRSMTVKMTIVICLLLFSFYFSRHFFVHKRRWILLSVFHIHNKFLVFITTPKYFMSYKRNFKLCNVLFHSCTKNELVYSRGVSRNVGRSHEVSEHIKCLNQ
jgi:hypothetical protein